MSQQNYPKFYRQRFILTLLKEAGGCLTKMDFQKLLFLSHQETESQYYDFVPYYYGCYSFQATSDLEALQHLGWVLLEEDHITLLRNLPGEKGLKQTETTGLVKFMDRYAGCRNRRLVRHIYERYPYYAVKSRIARDVLSPDAFKRIEKERKNLQNQETVLFTMGYEGISFEKYVNTLLKNDIRLLCDVRINPLSRKFGFSKGILSRLLPKLGIQYCHIPELGIVSRNRKHLKTEEDYRNLFDQYKINLQEKMLYLNKIMELLGTHKRIALICFEKQASWCHRHCISDYLKEERDVRVKHL